jgi:poly-gamma-glutamate synthesis protein (capsule biosynthesis protein)
MTLRLRSIFLFFSLVLLLSHSRSVNCEEQPAVSLYAVGDVMLGRYIARVMAEQGNDYPFKQIAPVLSRADIVFGNLESVISPDDVAPAYPEKPYSFHASAAAAQSLKSANFQVLNLANNHAMDYGLAPLAETKRLLAEKGIATFGAGKDLDEARQAVIITKAGMRFGFLGYGVAHARSVYATKKRSGIAPMRMDDIRRDVESVRSKVDVLVVSLHWGREYDTSPSQKQRVEAHQIIDWGADLIVGHHPHVMQGIELYKGGIIAYSLGNFIFDQKDNETKRSFILACSFRGKALSSAEIIPLNRFRSYFPRPAEGKSKKSILKDLRNISLPLNSDPGGLVKVGLY